MQVASPPRGLVALVSLVDPLTGPGMVVLGSPYTGGRNSYIPGMSMRRCETGTFVLNSFMAIFTTLGTGNWALV